MDEAEPVPSRDDFKTAIICAKGLEAEAVEYHFTTIWASGELGKHDGDENTYTAGKIGNALVVLVWLAGYGRSKAASATAQLRSSFKNIEHALVVGICGGVPKTSDSQEITLGDIVISESLQQYDVGKQFPNGYRTGYKTVPSKGLGSFLIALCNGQRKKALHVYLGQYLERLLKQYEESDVTVSDPGKQEDILYEPTYIHKHYPPSQCDICTKTEAVCEEARQRSCSELNCNTSETARIIPRARHQRSSNTSNPKIHFGVVGSGDTVMKSAQHRDTIAERENIIAFEMEGAGVFETIQSIVVIKSVCDYADSHKNKKWQRYAAIIAAACAGAYLKLKEEEAGSEPQSKGKSSHASIATPYSAILNQSSLGLYYTPEPQLTRHATMNSRSFTAGPQLSRHASDGGSFAYRPHMQMASHPYHMGPPAWPHHMPNYYGMPVNYGTPGNGWDLPHPMPQSLVSSSEVRPDAHLARSQTFPPQAHQHDDDPNPAFPTLSILGGPHQDDTTAPTVPTLSTSSSSDQSTGKPAEETAHLILEACGNPIALNNLLADPAISLNAQNCKGKTVAHLVLGTANVVTKPDKMRRINMAMLMLSQKRIPLDVPDHQGMTPLHLCVKTGNTDVAKFLVNIVNVNAVDSEGRTPLYLFGQDGSPVLEMGEILLRAGARLGEKKLPPLTGKPKQVQRKVREQLIQARV